MVNSNGNNIDKDDRALEALLAAAFHMEFSEEISDEKAILFFQQPARLSHEDKETINSWGTDFVENIIEGQKTVTDRFQHNIEINQELEQELFALNRDKDGNDINEEARCKIDEERKKALEEENNKEDDPSNES
jgi:hypothetical protein